MNQDKVLQETSTWVEMAQTTEVNPPDETIPTVTDPEESAELIEAQQWILLRAIQLLKAVNLTIC
ncbi:MAG: hypothetical protein BRC47_03000 [Cyanobacteria bacterium QS_7_48_42]|nr:MAG: hypothetical protein BRC38_10935 [Cyanobacteria bacterium QH_6_48_35]PSP04976.1 MAG: hypothetical protein BRC47_03000 [Cyanobacteria bacterium QS_7_48_42]PSP08301.1 MAG: hypothetical protein BRC54_02090 [Cyanobacteria bacterium SW_7_48_12]PSP08891.1 MAG: hypothetical protein BRC49_14665 [Cyanobacteria bacterium SW_10_48_33]PSP13698.1 MAG: hypothetical protein BRC50_05950 [Cyanobacteria bacterium SW_11_48_12]PSP14989.1 MAG: hypothetical protein BRC52_17345 [Cyanobacteria bacterium SW_5_